MPSANAWEQSYLPCLPWAFRSGSEQISALSMQSKALFVFFFLRSLEYRFNVVSFEMYGILKAAEHILLIVTLLNLRLKCASSDCSPLFSSFCDRTKILGLIYSRRLGKTVQSKFLLGFWDSSWGLRDLCDSCLKASRDMCTGKHHREEDWREAERLREERWAGSVSVWRHQVPDPYIYIFKLKKIWNLIYLFGSWQKAGGGFWNVFIEIGPNWI